MRRTVPLVSKPLAALAALLALANCAAANDPAATRGAASPAAEAAEAAGLVSEAERACLAEAIYFEATPAAESQRAVAHVILNRAGDPRFPRTVCGVVRDGCQFSYRCSGRSLALSDAKKRAAAERMAAAALSGAPDPTKGALFFHSAAVRPGWFSTRSRVGVIGGNVFYR